MWKNNLETWTEELLTRSVLLVFLGCFLLCFTALSVLIWLIPVKTCDVKVVAWFKSLMSLLLSRRGIRVAFQISHLGNFFFFGRGKLIAPYECTWLKFQPCLNNYQHVDTFHIHVLRVHCGLYLVFFLLFVLFLFDESVFRFVDRFNSLVMNKMHTFVLLRRSLMAPCGTLETWTEETKNKGTFFSWIVAVGLLALRLKKIFLCCFTTGRMAWFSIVWSFCRGKHRLNKQPELNSMMLFSPHPCYLSPGTSIQWH